MTALSALPPSGCPTAGIHVPRCHGDVLGGVPFDGDIRAHIQQRSAGFRRRLRNVSLTFGALGALLAATSLRGCHTPTVPAVATSPPTRLLAGRLHVGWSDVPVQLGMPFLGDIWIIVSERLSRYRRCPQNAPPPLGAFRTAAALVSGTDRRDPLESAHGATPAHSYPAPSCDIRGRKIRLLGVQPLVRKIGPKICQRFPWRWLGEHQSFSVTVHTDDPG
jgi:hypothetical protein